jgi:hypothetical protein
MRNRISHLTTYAAPVMCMLALGGLSLNCVNKPLPPVAPTWETHLTAPVSTRSYTLADLVTRDSTLFSVAPGGTQLMYGTTFQADPTFVGNLVSLAPLAVSSSVQIGAFSVSVSAYSLPVAFPAWFPKGTTTVIPQATIPFNPLQGTLPGLDSVTFKSGTVEMHVRNNLPVSVTVMNPVTLTNAGGAVCGTFDFSVNGPILPGHESISSVNLAGVFLTRSVSISGVTLFEPGSAVALPVPADSLVVVTLVAVNPVVRSAIVTSLPAQLAASNVTKSLAVTDSNLVKDLAVKSGTITMHFQSSLAVTASFSYTMGQVLTPGGTPFSDVVTLPARGTFNRTINLGGYRLHSADGGFITSLDVTGSIALTQNGGGPVKVQETDNIAYTLTSTSIVADSVVGVMKPTWVNVNTVLPVKLGDLSKKFRGQVNIPAANLRLTPQSTIRFPLQLDLKLDALSDRGQILSEMDVPRQKMNGTLPPIDFLPGDVGRFLSAISGQLPDSLRVTGAVLINPDYDLSTQALGSTSWFGGQVQVSFPLTCSLTGGLFADTASIGDTSGSGQGHTLVDGKTAADINTITLHVVVDNAIPLQVAMKLNFLDGAKRLLLSLPQTAGDSITIPAPVVSGGVVQSPAHAERIVQLTGTEVQQFNNAYSLAYNLDIATAGSGAVQFGSTQTIRIRVWAEFSYQVNK